MGLQIGSQNPSRHVELRGHCGPVPHRQLPLTHESVRAPLQMRQVPPAVPQAEKLFTWQMSFWQHPLGQVVPSQGRHAEPEQPLGQGEST